MTEELKQHIDRMNVWRSFLKQKLLVYEQLSMFDIQDIQRDVLAALDLEHTNFGGVATPTEIAENASYLTALLKELDTL